MKFGINYIYILVEVVFLRLSYKTRNRVRNLSILYFYMYNNEIKRKLIFLLKSNARPIHCIFFLNTYILFQKKTKKQ